VGHFIVCVAAYGQILMSLQSLYILAAFYSTSSMPRGKEQTAATRDGYVFPQGNGTVCRLQANVYQGGTIMSISSISSSTNVYQNQFQQVRTDFSTLQTSLSSGNVTASQQAYAALTQDLQNAQQSQGGQQAGGRSQLTTDLTAVGTALQSGNITGARSAFAALMQELQGIKQTQTGQKAHKGHHHHHLDSSSQAADTSLTTDLTAVGTALQSGNITGAQSAFATLMQDLGTSGAQNTTGTAGNSTNLQAVGSIIDTVA
jgi:hypothetical protein